MISVLLSGPAFQSQYLFLPERSEGADFPPRPWAKVCPFCLTIWAKLDLPETGCKQIHSVPCATCLPLPIWQFWLPNLPGSLIYNTSYQSTEWDLFLALPGELTRREADLHFTLYSTEDTRTNTMLTPEELSKLQLYRDRINSGEQMTLEENQEAVRLLRANRLTASQRAQASKASKSPASRTKKPAQSGSALLGQLGIPGLGS